MRNLYHIQGVTDLQKMIDSAMNKSSESETITIHHHRIKESCNDLCKVVNAE